MASLPSESNNFQSEQGTALKLLIVCKYDRTKKRGMMLQRFVGLSGSCSPNRSIESQGLSASSLIVIRVHKRGLLLCSAVGRFDVVSSAHITKVGLCEDQGSES